MRPARQGAFDGLCGVYAVINALDLAGLKRRRSALHKNLFRELTNALGAAALLEALEHGLDTDDLARAAKFAFQQLARDEGVNLTVELPFAERVYDSVSGFLADLRPLVSKPRHAIILQVRLNGTWHWTVAQALTARRLNLRDSGGRRALHLDRFEIGAGPNQFAPSETLLLTCGTA